jgi:hypothetical protein
VPIKEEYMLKATLAVKVAAGVLGGVLLTGGGIALATDTLPTFNQPSLKTDQPSGAPGATCAADDENDQGAMGTHAPDAEASGEAGDHNAQGTHAPDAEASGEAGDHNAQGTHAPDAEASGEAGDNNEQGEDCDQDGDHAGATEGPDTEKSEGPEAGQTGNSGNHSQGDEGRSTPMPSGTRTGSDG